MSNSDLLAYIYAQPDEFGYASNAIKSCSRYTPSAAYNPPPRSRHERGGTIPPGSDGNGEETIPRLVLKLSDIPRTRLGVVFGTNPRCDVVLPSLPGISSQHFSVTVDEQGRLIVRDLSSLLGTEVTYDKRGAGLRSNFQWIIAGDRELPSIKEIVIRIQSDMNIRFRIKPFSQDLSEPRYVQNLKRFRLGRESAESLFGDLSFLSGPVTVRNAGAHTPKTHPIHLQTVLGTGGFGQVIRCWNVSNASRFVMKGPKPNVPYDEIAWVEEATLLKRLSHPNIVKFLWSTFSPVPQIGLEYLEFGTLSQQANITRNEGILILRQCLDALDYLHSQKPPVAHRDISPVNILVASRSSSGSDIVVKMSDFGLSKAENEHDTVCGVDWYRAPELTTPRCPSLSNHTILTYTCLADIWSLGVVLFEVLYHFRSHGKFVPGTMEWCQNIATELTYTASRSRDGIMSFLKDHMVIMDARKRTSARDCKAKFVLRTTNEARPRPTSPNEYNLHSNRATAGSNQEVERLRQQGVGPRADLVRLSTSGSNTSVPGNRTTSGQVKRPPVSPVPAPSSAAASVPRSERQVPSSSSQSRLALPSQPQVSARLAPSPRIATANEPSHPPGKSSLKRSATSQLTASSSSARNVNLSPQAPGQQPHFQSSRSNNGRPIDCSRPSQDQVLRTAQGIRLPSINQMLANKGATGDSMPGAGPSSQVSRPSSAARTGQTAPRDSGKAASFWRRS